MTTPILIDAGPSPRGWSFYGSFARCPLLFFWRYIAHPTSTKARSDMTHPFARGGTMHVALAHHYARQWASEIGRDPDRICSPIEAIRIHTEKLGENGHEISILVQSMFEAYTKRYPIESFKVLTVEQPREIRFGDALFTARVDLEVRESDGRVWIWDHKTTARIETKTTRRYDLHGQFFGLHYFGRQVYGDRFSGVMINVIAEDGECKREVHRPAPFMYRAFPRVIEELDAQIKHAIARYGQDAEAWSRLAKPDEQICFGPYGACPKLEECKWGEAAISF